MNDAQEPTGPWMLDSSTFIHASMIDRVKLLASLRSPLFFPEYIFRWELGADAREETRADAEKWVNRFRLIGIQQLTLDDLDRVAKMDAPRRISYGEICCAVIAERETGSVLCDDRRARQWLESRVRARAWETIEGFLLNAAELGHLGEADLWDHQQSLFRHNYKCSCDLRQEFARRWLNSHARPT